MAKSTEILELYLKFRRGEEISKSEIATYFGNKSPRTIQRYVSSLNQFFSENEDTDQLKIEYDRTKNVYFMKETKKEVFDKQHILVILKILISTRGLSKSEIKNVIEQLTSTVNDEDKRIINQTIKSELYHYKEMSHEEPLFNKIWELNKVATEGKSIKFTYYNAWNQEKEHIIRPLYTTFSELYFYVVGANEKGYTLIYRVDCIQNFEIVNLKIKNSGTKYYQEGELKKRAYFMYGGDWKRVTFEFNGGIIESVLDRFPTAKLLKKDFKENKFTVEVEVIGDGIVMWLLSQGSRVKVLSPKSIKDKYLEEINKIMGYY
ncbi:helix-turn-helix transcriptional regulator [Mammaliicoccus vitulinus]|uniref:WYL domain-containing protein n=2 Tax=Mammaliicoccus vitulinus TaxID=71237 RepID=A0ABX7HHI3_9STAP|nr:WYL domain-containing protein [Mammaliicoccus vitulinus]PNZ38640.1 WYL domain-containing protein [Mammaliicoccus vitulinus]QRO86075.1 WYL domain-containing protein [Mammaliicoccus vitulinus]